MGDPPKYRAHLVLVPMFIPSHSLPLFDFAFRLASLSIKVTILSSAYHVRQVWTHPLYWRTTPRLLAAGDSIELVPVEDGIYDASLQGFKKTVMEVASEKIFVSKFGKHLGLLMAMVPKPCCVVSDMVVGWTQELAKEFGIPRFVLHVQPASNLSLMLHLLPPGFEERTRKQGKVVTMVVPQIHILQHPACGAFLSHCGWNSVLESITSAVPIIAWPQQFEQWMTARYLIDTMKVAVELHEEKRGFVSRKEIQRVVHLVMHEVEGHAFRTRATELKQLAANYAYCNTHLDSFLDGLIM